MKRKIVQIDSEKCTGCGACADACHEHAIAMLEDGKAHLIKDDYCDGLGDCLPSCPADAITIITRDADPYDEKAVSERKKALKALEELKDSPAQPVSFEAEEPTSLRQWPVQLKLVPPRAPFFDGADLLVAADCTAYAYAAFHRDFLRGKALVVACPKLDGTDYSVKLEAILRMNDIRSVTVLRMEVPCCGGLEYMAKKALAASGKQLELHVTVIGTEGSLLSNN